MNKAGRTSTVCVYLSLCVCAPFCLLTNNNLLDEAVCTAPLRSFSVLKGVQVGDERLGRTGGGCLRRVQIHTGCPVLLYGADCLGVWMFGQQRDPVGLVYFSTRRWINPG